mmetsp:Transcript_21182/g.39549  ORF Transcript_21182/g.39549 Transcript_21182/m.39549 type:complete len:156 (+) Transcript_21182:89-556(+)
MADTASAAESTATRPLKKHAVNLQEVQETVSRLAAHKGVMAVLILNASGDIVTQSGSGDGAIGNPKLLAKMLHAANMYVCSMPSHKEDRDGDAHDGNGEEGQEGSEEAGAFLAVKKNAEENISFVRIRTQRDEILVAPKLGYTLVVLQDPGVSSL